jgi:hypothetical protein
MSTFKSLDQNTPKVIIENEDNSFSIFMKLLMKSELLKEGRNVNQLRCSQVPPKVTFGNKFKKVETELSLYEGAYHVNWNGN